MRLVTPYPPGWRADSIAARLTVIPGLQVIVAVLAPKSISTLSTSGRLFRAARTLCVHEEGQCMPDTPTIMRVPAGAADSANAVAPVSAATTTSAVRIFIRSPFGPVLAASLAAQ